MIILKCVSWFLFWPCLIMIRFPKQLEALLIGGVCMVVMQISWIIFLFRLITGV